MNIREFQRNKLPDGFVYIGRPTIYGNPYKIGLKYGNRDEVINKYRRYFLDRIMIDPEFEEAVRALKGKTLVCWCPPERCHGEVIEEWIMSN